MALRAWDKVEEPRKSSTLYKTLENALLIPHPQRLISAVIKVISDPEAKQLIKSLKFKYQGEKVSENLKNEFKKLIRPLKVWAVPMNKGYNQNWF